MLAKWFTFWFLFLQVMDVWKGLQVNLVKLVTKTETKYLLAIWRHIFSVNTILTLIMKNLFQAHVAFLFSFFVLFSEKKNFLLNLVYPRFWKIFYMKVVLKTSLITDNWYNYMIFEQKYLLYFIIWPNFIFWLPLLCDILGNVRTVIVF